MQASSPARAAEPRENLFSAADIESILRERGWLKPDARQTDAVAAWTARAAFLLGPQAADKSALADLLSLVFHYDAAAVLREPSSIAALGREGARNVIRELALAVLESPPVDSGQFKVIVDAVKATLQYGGRELFYPLRLALAGRAGPGELDRVILLIDAASAIEGLVPVKNIRQRMLEFCLALE
jgi:hypothetical protein